MSFPNSKKFIAADFECKTEEPQNEVAKAHVPLSNRLTSSKKATKKILKLKPKLEMGIKNDTKNIPKNYGKAILSFILRSPKTLRLAANLNINVPDFLIQIKKMKTKINSIEGLRKMWGSDNIENKSKKFIRIMSYQFMRKQCLRYIFHSKVKNFGTHIKYRQKLIEGIENP